MIRPRQVKKGPSSIEVGKILFSAYASESNIPNKNVAMSSAKPTMVADLSSSSCSISITLNFYK